MLRCIGYGAAGVAAGGVLWMAMATWLWPPPDWLSLAAGGVFYLAGYCFGGWREAVRIDRAG